MELLISCELKKPVEDMRLRDSKVSVYQGQPGADIHLGALQRKKNCKNPRLLWKWVGGSRSHSDFFGGKIVPKLP